MKSNPYCQRFAPWLLATMLAMAAHGCQKTATAELPINSVTSTTTAAAPTSSTTDPPTGSVADEPQSNPSQQNADPQIRDGYYAMGGTGQGLEVRGDQYRYYDELGDSEWQPISQLTVLAPDHLFDGESHWCHSDTTPASGGICTASGWQAYDSIGKISPSQLALGGVEAGATEAEVIDQLGQPDQIDRDSAFSVRLTYPGLSVSVFEDAALTIRSVRASYCTPSGLCPGDAVSEAEQLYGAPLVEERDQGEYWQYVAPEVACTMELEVTNETIEAIALLCQI